MYLCYCDESGDGGLYDEMNPSKTGSPYFILVGLIVHESQWKVSLETLKGYRKKLAAQAYLPYDVEFHCSEMIDPHKIKEYTQISVPDRWKLIEGFAETIGNNKAFQIIGISIDKKASALKPEEYITAATTKLYQIFDEFLKAQQQNGIVIYDRANEKHITTHVRKLMGTGSSGQTIPGVRIGWVIEDPIFRLSHDSIFIQASDVIAFTLKEKEFPQGSRKKFYADRIFTKKLSSICIKSRLTDEEGIVRL